MQVAQRLYKNECSHFIIVLNLAISFVAFRKKVADVLVALRMFQDKKRGIPFGIPPFTKSNFGNSKTIFESLHE